MRGGAERKEMAIQMIATDMEIQHPSRCPQGARRKTTSQME